MAISRSTRRVKIIVQNILFEIIDNQSIFEGSMLTLVWWAKFRPHAM